MTGTFPSTAGPEYAWPRAKPELHEEIQLDSCCQAQRQNNNLQIMKRHVWYTITLQFTALWVQSHVYLIDNILTSFYIVSDLELDVLRNPPRMVCFRVCQCMLGLNPDRGNIFWGTWKEWRMKTQGKSHELLFFLPVTMFSWVSWGGAEFEKVGIAIIKPCLLKS